MIFALGYSNMSTHWEVHCAIHSYTAFIHDPSDDDTIPLKNYSNVMDHLLDYPSP